jgi:tetratricopeptide (TPR) repeat protein
MLLALFAWLAGMAASNPLHQQADDPEIRTAVERFYAAQEAEDTTAYLALWSTSAQRPTPAQLRYIFDSGDDRFSDLVILRVTPTGQGVLVRASVTRDRTNTAFRRPDGSTMTNHSVMIVSLLYVRENGEWKLAREGSAADGLAQMLLEAPTAEQREQLMAAEPELVGSALVRSVARLGDAFAQNRQFALAQGAYERVIEVAQRVGDTKLQAEALQNLGNSKYFQRDFAGALAAYQGRLVIEREAANDDGIVGALLGIATTRYSRYEYSDALTTYREAQAIQERQKDDAGLPTTLISAGNVQYIQGDYAGAIVDYRRARDLYRQIPNTTGEARALEGLGRSFTAQGDYSGALDAYAGVLEEGRARQDRAMQGTALQSVGEIHFRLGNLYTARPLFDRSREHFEAVNDMPNVGRVWQAAALTDLVAGRFAAAEQEYGSSAASCGATSASGGVTVTAVDNECVARAVVGLAYAQFSQEHFTPAVLSYRKAIALFTAAQKPEDAERAEIGLSQALLGLHDNAGALGAAGRARESALANSHDDVLWRAQLAEARALRRIGRVDEKAMAAVKAAVSTIDRMAEAALDRPGATVPPDSGAAFALLAVLQADAGDAEGAFATIEQKHAHALRVALATNERDIARGLTSAERDAERATASAVVTARVQLEHETSLPKPDAARVRRLQEGVGAAITSRRALREQLFTRLPELRTWRGLSTPAVAADAVALLPDAGSVILEIVIDDDDLLALTTVRREEGTTFHARVTPTSRQTLAEGVARALDPAVLRNVEAWRTAATELVGMFPPEAWRDLTSSTRAIVVPDGVLWRVPFEALPAAAGYLGDSTAVLYTGSITSLVRAPAAPPRPEGRPLVAVGLPDLSAPARERVATIAPGWTLRSAESADAELQALTMKASDPAAVVLAGAAATETAVRSGAAGASALHFAAPFRMNGASPLFSPLLLLADQAAGAAPVAANDGVLEAREVMNLDLNARVAVFSDGAATSMRDAAPAAEVVWWAWRAAGVPSIVMSRWAVEDDAGTGAMLADFHARLASGTAPEVALQAAQTTRRAHDDARAPYSWAGWLLVGR